MINEKKEKIEKLEESIFEKINMISIIQCITTAVIPLVSFLALSIKVWKILYSGKIYWYLILFTLCGMVLIPYMICKCFFRMYCSTIERIKNGMLIFWTEKFRQERCKEMQNPVDKIVCIGVLLLFVIFFVSCLIFPDIIQYKV